MTTDLSSPARTVTVSIPVKRDDGALPAHVRVLARTGSTGTSRLSAPLREARR